LGQSGPSTAVDSHRLEITGIRENDDPAIRGEVWIRFVSDSAGQSSLLGPV
jgi:hypothetical protein